MPLTMKEVEEGSVGDLCRSLFRLLRRLGHGSTKVATKAATKVLIGRVLAIGSALFTVLTLNAADVNWPEFRGPRGDGTSTSTNLPLQWSEQHHVKWKTGIHDRGWSSPVIWDRQVWLTTATTRS